MHTYCTFIQQPTRAGNWKKGQAPVFSPLAPTPKPKHGHGDRPNTLTHPSTHSQPTSDINQKHTPNPNSNTPDTQTNVSRRRVPSGHPCMSLPRYPLDLTTCRPVFPHGSL
ncbi:unnamed protein product [Ectocarpus sp. 13 AM-2016]